MWGLEHSIGAAATSGLEPSTSATVTSRIERHSYGFVTNYPFDDRIHDVTDRFIDPVEGVPMARNQMCWLVKKGSVVQNGIPFKSDGSRWITEADLRSTPFTKWAEMIHYCDEDVPPTSSKSKSNRSSVLR